MKTISKDTEKILLESLQNRLALPGETFCLHIGGSFFGPEEFQLLPSLLETWIGHDGGEIYICRDRDIFAFSPNLTEKSFSQFRERFKNLFEKTPSGIRKPLSFYNIGIQGLGLIELAKGKLAREEKRRAEEESRDLEQARTQKKARFFSIILEQDMKGALNKRRQARTKPEILVVEDDPFSRKLIAGVLPNFSVSFAEDGYAALMAYLQKAPDLVFLDIDLPDVTGNEILDRIIAFDPDTYIVMLSGNSQSENVIKCMKAGAKGFIGKPFTKDKLLQYIGKCSRRSPEDMRV